jgi:hypothetical protein
MENLGGVKLKHLLEIQTNTEEDRQSSASASGVGDATDAGEWTIPLLSFLMI